VRRNTFFALPALASDPLSDCEQNVGSDPFSPYSGESTQTICTNYVACVQTHLALAPGCTLSGTIQPFIEHESAWQWFYIQSFSCPGLPPNEVVSSCDFPAEIDFFSGLDLYDSAPQLSQGGTPLPQVSGIPQVAPGVATQVMIPIGGLGFNSPETRSTTLTLQAISQTNPPQILTLAPPQTISMSDIPASGTLNVLFTVTFDPSLSGTTQTITATIDPGNGLNESNFADNISTVQVDIDNTLTINSILAQNVTVSSTGTITGLVDLSYTYDGVPVNTSVPFCTSCGQPVSLASGSMWHQMTDFSVPGRTPATALTLTRSYIANPVTQGHDFGPNWFSNFETRILPLSSGTNSNLAWVDDTGGVWIFTQNSNGSFTSPSGFFGTLVESSNSFQLTKPHGIVYTFSNNSTQPATFGKLLSITEPHGESVSLAYDGNGNLLSASTGLAGSISFARNTSGQVTQVTRERDGLSYTYSYDSSSRLSSSADFDGNTTTYGYTSTPTNLATNSLLSTITDPLNRAITFSYQADGRAVSQTEPGNAVRSFKYGTDGGNSATWVTDIDGTVSEYQFDTNYRTIKVIHPDGSIDQTAWNSHNQIAQTTDALGYVTKLGYDTNGNLTSIQKPADTSPTTIAYNETFDVPTLITPLVGAPTQTQINPATGDIIAISRTSGATSLNLALTYDPFGNHLSTNNGLATYSNETDANGLLTLIFDARNPETRTNDSRGRLITRTFKTGRGLSYSYDNYDRVLGVVDSNGPSLLRTYDIMGRVLTQTLTDGKTNQATTYQWDVRDRLISSTDAEGHVTTRQYDEAGPSGTTLVIDKPLAVTDPLGHKTQLQYDDRQRLIAQIDANAHTTHYTYNARGDLVTLTDPSNQKTAFSFDGNARMISRSRPSLLTDAKGNTSAVSEVTQYFYDAAGKLIEEQKLSASGDGVTGVTQLIYDPFDRVVEKVEKLVGPTGSVTIQDDSTFVYAQELDAQQLVSANNSVEKLSFTHEFVPPFATQSYSAQASDAKNALGLIQGTYTVSEDITNQIGSITDSEKHTLFSADYDPAGRLIKMASGNLFGNPSTTTNAILGRLLGLQPQAPSLTSTVEYDSFGRKESVSHSTGLSGTIAYDLLNRPTQISWEQAGANAWTKSNSFASESLSYDASGNVVGSSVPYGQISNGYDSTNQLTNVSLAEDMRLFPGFELKGKFSRSLTYDPSGNRTEDSLLGASQYLDDQITTNAISSFQSDVNGWGTLANETDRVTKIEKQYTYRMDGKLTTLTKGWNTNPKMDYSWGDANVLSVNYSFDALGRRVAKSVQLKAGLFGQMGFTQTYAYLVDQDKVLLAKAGNGNLTLYLDAEGIDEHLGAVSQFQATGYAIDHLGSVMNSAAAGPLHAYGPFGETLPGWAPLLAWDSDVVNYGYTGRQFDSESGEYYYRARMYNPATGRFTTRDPLGLNGGDNNLYRYVGNNPLVFVDSTGKLSVTDGAITIVAAVVVGTGVGAGVALVGTIVVDLEFTAVGTAITTAAFPLGFVAGTATGATFLITSPSYGSTPASSPLDPLASLHLTQTSCSLN
jgi:RHS repeat-associated protein